MELLTWGPGMEMKDGGRGIFCSPLQQLRDAFCFGGEFSICIVVCGEGCIQINLVKSLQSLCKRYDHRISKKSFDPPGLRSYITRVQDGLDTVLDQEHDSSATMIGVQ